MILSTFETFHLDNSILRALSDEGYELPTEVQQQTIPQVLSGKDVMATAQTGTGKTAAFALPILEMLRLKQTGAPGAVRALILTPTRELAIQVESSFRTYGRHLSLRSAVVVGGVSMESQIKAIRSHPDILVATPGRLLDLVRQRLVRLGQVEILVLDEADRMLDMGFIHDVRSIVDETPKARQTLLFSATLSNDVLTLAHDMMKDPVRVQITPPASVAENIDQKIFFVEQANKGALLASILKGKEVRRALVFTRTKHRADRIVQQLSRQGISAGAMHSNKTQSARQKVLSAFDGGRLNVLVATDIVARGIDVEGISHVINYDVPSDASSYVHRVGRTARAGAAGIAISLCDTGEVMLLREIEKLTRSPLTTVEDQPYHSAMVASLHQPSAAMAARPAQWRSFGPGGRGGRRSR